MKYPWARQKPIQHNFEKGMRANMNLPTHGLVLHVDGGGAGIGGMLEHFNRQAPDPPPGEKQKVFYPSAHFFVTRAGEVYQFLDTDDRAHAVGGDTPNDGKWLSVENQAKRGQELSDEQLDEVAVLFTWLSKMFGFPLQVAAGPGDKGLGTHDMFHNSDHDCPGQAVVDQMPKIIEKAKFYAVHWDED